MEYNKLIEKIIDLFESKLINYSEKTIKTWTKILSNLDQKKVLKRIDELMYSKERYIQLSDIYNSVIDKENKIVRQGNIYDN